jgi:hypothetical protein
VRERLNESFHTGSLLTDVQVDLINALISQIRPQNYLDLIPLYFILPMMLFSQNNEPGIPFKTAQKRKT